MTNQMTDQSIGALIDLDPASLTIATNVRTDVAEDKDFANSIKTRGVLEPVTVYLAEDGTYAVLRGQRRTLTAARVGTRRPGRFRVASSPDPTTLTGSVTRWSRTSTAQE